VGHIDAFDRARVQPPNLFHSSGFTDIGLLPSEPPSVADTEKYLASEREIVGEEARAGRIAVSAGLAL
jgi:hypothetical protein